MIHSETRNSPENFSVVFITVDSCNFETAKNANTPILNSVSKVRKCYTSSTYTYPAHHSFFLGHLPELIENKYYFDNYGKVWRSTQAWDTGDKVAIYYETSTIIEFYEKKGFDTRGFGGVGFFNNSIKQNLLPKMFKNFTYFDSDQKSRGSVPRSPEKFPLNHIDEIVTNLNDKNGFFIFINEIATHIPYDHPNTSLPNNYKELSKKLVQEHYMKKSYKKGYLPFSADTIEMFKNEQIKSLEWIDIKLGEMLSKLPKKKPILVIVLGDHGEEFGEGGKFGHFHFHPTVMTVPLWCGVV